jgi:uncharacterized protein
VTKFAAKTSGRCVNLAQMGILLVFLAWLGPHSAVWAQNLVPIPALTSHVIDQTGTLDAVQTRTLDTKLANFERDKGSQIVVLLVPSTQPEDIAAFAQRVGDSWKIGRKTVGDGLILVVAKADRKVRIEVAKTLEGAVPDLAASHIIDDAITPNFKLGHFALGLEAATDQLMARISGEALPAPASDAAWTGGDSGIQWQEMLIFLGFGVLLGGGAARNFFGRKFGSLLAGVGAGAFVLFVTASLLFAALAAFVALVFNLFVGASEAARAGRGFAGRGGRGGLGTGGWTSGSGGFDGGGSSSGGGGFSSGGGGDFGGGGASGSW